MVTEAFVLYRKIKTSYVPSLIKILDVVIGISR